MSEQTEDQTNLEDVMHELRQLRYAVQELSRIVQQSRQSQPMPNDGSPLLRDMSLRPWS